MAALVALPEVESFVLRCMTAIGTKHSHAKALAKVLAAADYRGHFSHGLNRLEMYVRDIQTKICVSDSEPAILKESAATAFVDGKNLLGPVVGNFCMDLAIRKAKEAGIGWVVAKGSNHFGIAGWYSLRAVDQGLLGMAFTNTSPLQVPTRAKKPILGTNPLSVAAPAQDGDSFVLDMATSAVALGKIEYQRRKHEPIPVGWAVDKDGRVTTDSVAASTGGALMPLGGSEVTSGYKGYGLAMMVEIFCGILGGAAFGSNVRRWMDTTATANLGQCFVALDPGAFAPGFEGRMSELMEMCRQEEPTNISEPVLIAGDPERQHMETCNKQGGISYHPNQIKACMELAVSLKIEPLRLVVG